MQEKKNEWKTRGQNIFKASTVPPLPSPNQSQVDPSSPTLHIQTGSALLTLLRLEVWPSEALWQYEMICIYKDACFIFPHSDWRRMSSAYSPWGPPGGRSHQGVVWGCRGPWCKGKWCTEAPRRVPVTRWDTAARPPPGTLGEDSNMQYFYLLCMI